MFRLGSICNLYRWRYRALGDLGHVTRLPEYRAANAGLRYDFQLVNVDDFNGAGETEPSPYFYQVTQIPTGNYKAESRG